MKILRSPDILIIPALLSPLSSLSPQASPSIIPKVFNSGYGIYGRVTDGNGNPVQGVLAQATQII